MSADTALRQPSRVRAVLTEMGRPFSYYPGLAKKIGNVNATVLTCMFAFWDGRGRDPEGWIFKSVQEITDETGLSRDEQQTARKLLKSIGLLEEVKRGMPATNHYRLNFPKLDELPCFF